MINFLNLDKSQFTNLDSAQTIFFLRELENIKTRIFETPYAPLKANQLIPIDSTTPPGATTVTYTIYDRTGSAKIISNYADDLPSADTKGQQITSNLRSIGNYFEFSLEDIRAAQFAGKPLQQRKANSALQEQLLLANKIAFFGDAAAGVQGWLNNPNIPIAPVAGANPAARLWSTKVATPKLILDDLNEITRTVVSTTNGVETIDTIVMPIEQYQIIANTQLGIGTDTTILQFYVRNNPGVTVTWANELKAAFASNTDGMIAYRNSIDKFWQEIPQPFEMFAPQWTNLTYKVPCHSKHGGTIVVYPKSQAIRTGI
jgi:hypothetical protein